NGSCCHKCQLLPKTHVCRPSASICDVEEYCTASSPFCPADTFIKDGTICGSNELKCASGHCTSRDAQCLSRGATLNVTRSCVTNNEECQVLCNSPGNTEKCLLISGFFINGTPCGFNGHCIDGTCKNGDAISSGVFWMEEHKIITIPGCILVLFSMSILLFLISRIGCRIHWEKIQFLRRTSYRRLPDYSASSIGIQDLIITSNSHSETSSIIENDLLYEDKHRYNWNSRVSSDSTIGENFSHSSSNSTVVEDVYIHSDCINKL
ncbi:Disintegrin-domain-containing protein, partial [Backusella circina FSU 941]